MDTKRHKADCSSIGAWLSSFLDGELKAEEMLRIENHLRECPDCREEYELLGTLSKHLREEGRKIPDAPAWTSLEGRIPVRGGVINRFAFWLKSPQAALENYSASGLWYRRFAIMAGLTMVLLATGYFINVQPFPDQDRIETPAEIIKKTPAPMAFAIYPGHSLTENLISLLQSQEAGSSGFKELLAFTKAKEADIETLESEVGFKTTVSEKLPRGFEFDKCYILNSVCCSSVYSSYNNGLEVISVFQQAPGHSFASNFDGFKNENIGGVDCRVLEVNGFEIINVEPNRRNLLIVSRQNVLNGEILKAALTTTGSP